MDRLVGSGWFRVAADPTEWLGLKIEPLTNSPEMKTFSFFLTNTPLKAFFANFSAKVFF
jgi:hypothetical protein